jgi:hypothetical protein
MQFTVAWHCFLALCSHPDFSCFFSSSSSSSAISPKIEARLKCRARGGRKKIVWKSILESRPSKFERSLSLQ